MANSSALTAYMKNIVEDRKKSKETLVDLGVEAAKIQMKAGVDQAESQRKFGQDVELKRMEQQGQMERTKLEQRGQNSRLFRSLQSREKVATIQAGNKAQASKSTIDTITSISGLLDEFDATNQGSADSGKPGQEMIDVMDSKLMSAFPTGQASPDDIRDYVNDLYSNAKGPDAEYIAQQLGERFPEIFSKQGGTMSANQPRATETGKGGKTGTPGKVVKVGKYTAS